MDIDLDLYRYLGKDLFPVKIQDLSNKFHVCIPYQSAIIIIRWLYCQEAFIIILPTANCELLHRDDIIILSKFKERGEVDRVFPPRCRDVPRRLY